MDELINALKSLDQVFIPLFVAMTPLTVIPFYLQMADGLDDLQARSLRRKAIATAFGVAVAVTLAGQAIFRLLDITLHDLRIGGGMVLLGISITNLIGSQDRPPSETSTDVGAVPLGTPLLVGPGTMTTCLILADTYGRLAVILGLIANLALTVVVLANARKLDRILPPAAFRAFGKVMSLFMTAIAIRMIRAGLGALYKALR